jgi:outer membrane receptor protein involved in Fe transport
VNQLKYVLVLICALLTTNLFAQESGKITGTVVDAGSGETLIGVSVVIEGTIKGAASDIDGNFTIRNVAPGTYTLIASYLSFATQTITGVEIGEGETVKLDIALQPETELLDEIVVTAEVVLNNEAGLLRQRQKSIAFSDAISAESISKSGAGDAAGALKKVVGASVVGGKYVYVRGLGDRYSTAQLNGAELPSADPDKNAFQLDLIPSNVIENIVTLKSFTPDKPGNFSGGLVDITTKDFPEELLFNISTSFGYNTRSTFEDGNLGESSGSDIFGYDDGRRSIPDLVANTESIPEYGDSFLKVDEEHQANAQTMDAVSSAFNNEMVPASTTIPLNTGLKVSLGNQFLIGEKEFGYILGFSHKVSYDAYSDGESGYYQLVGNLDDQTILNTNSNYVDNKTDQNVDLGGLASVSFKPNGNNKFSASWLRTQSGTNQGRILSGYREEPAQGGYDSYNSTAIFYTQRKLSSVQLRGEHVIPALNNLKIDWQGTSSVNELEQPDIRFFEYGVRTNENTYSISRAIFQRPQRYFRTLNETNKNAFVDITLPIDLGSATANIKTGGFYLEGDREFNETRFAYEQDQISLNDYEQDFGGFFGATGIDQEATDANNFFIYYNNYIQDRTNPTNSYTGNREISAAYLMAELPIGDLKLIGGARYETTLIEVASVDTTAPTGNIDVNDILPSATAIYSFSDDVNFRIAYSKTLARPNYREIAPFSGFDAFGGFVNVGNPDLKRTLITNYDARLEWFPNPGEIVALSGFYKLLEDPIERIFLTDRVRTRSWQNVDEGTVYGVEFEVRKNLGFLTSALTDLSLATNLTLVHSEVNVPEEEYEIAVISDPDFSKTRNLYGQSPFILNLDLSYQNQKYDFTVDFNSNLFGDRLSDVTLGANPDVFERSYLTSDLIISKNFKGNFAASLTMGNLFDQRVESTSQLNGEEYRFSSYYKGRSISLSVSYKL